MLGVPTYPIEIELSWSWLATGWLPIWKPFLLGCLVMGALSALVGYILLSTLWHVTLVLKYHERKGNNSSKESKDG
jgi:hypothetical protein